LTVNSRCELPVQELVLQAEFPGFTFEFTEPGSLAHCERRLFAGVLTPIGVNSVPRVAS
jgi:hypothetical protein